MLLALDPRLARRIGALSLAVLALVGSSFVFLSGQLRITTPVRVRVLFRHSAGLAERAPLVVGGTQVGQVAAISPVPRGARGLLAGEPGVAVTVELRPEDAVRIPVDAAIFVAMRGPLSDRYLEVAPAAGAPGAPVHDGAELRGVDPPTLDDVLQRTLASLTTLQQFADTVRPELTALGAGLHRMGDEWRAITDPLRAGAGGVEFASAAGDLVAAARATWNALGGRSGLHHLLATSGEARRTLTQLRTVLDLLGAELKATTSRAARIHDHLASPAPRSRTEDILAEVRRSIDKLDAVLAVTAEISQRIADGEGSIGRLATDPEFPEDIKDLARYLKRHPWKILAHLPF